MDTFRLSADSIMKQIALELRYDSQELIKPSSNFWCDFDLDVRLAVTNDVYETTFDFTQCYGTGSAFHFSLSSYHEGVALIKELCLKLNVLMPDTTVDDKSFKPSDLLMLFVYVQNVVPRKNNPDDIRIYNR